MTWKRPLLARSSSVALSQHSLLVASLENRVDQVSFLQPAARVWWRFRCSWRPAGPRATLPRLEVDQ